MKDKQTLKRKTSKTVKRMNTVKQHVATEWTCAVCLKEQQRFPND